MPCHAKASFLWAASQLFACHLYQGGARRRAGNRVPLLSLSHGISRSSVPLALLGSQAPAMPPSAVTCCLLTRQLPPVCLLLRFPHPAARVSGSTHTLARVRGRVPALRLRRLKGKLDGCNPCACPLTLFAQFGKTPFPSGLVSLRGCH